MTLLAAGFSSGSLVFRDCCPVVSLTGLTAIRVGAE
jgi:hypothetical protein